MEALTGLAPLFTKLSRSPDLDADELQAYDTADELILATAADAVRAADDGSVVVIGDGHGALTVGAAIELGARGVRTHQDPVLGERALAQNARKLGCAEAYASHPIGEELLGGARVVLVQLPRGLEALDEIAWAIAKWAHPQVRVFAGARVKHMTRSQNEVLARYFSEVTAGLGWRKSRVLSAAGAVPVAGAAPFPKWGGDPDLGFQVAAYGATFGGPVLDHGSRLLLTGLRGDLRSGVTPTTFGDRARHVVDLGCGNGSLAVSAAKMLPEARVIATDQSTAAVAATRLTAKAAGVLVECGEVPGATSALHEGSPGVCVHRGDGLEGVPDGWADLILLNPPFHTGATVHAGVAHRLIRACGRALAPGGELRIVFNSHLRYRQLVERTVGPSREVVRNKTFTVLSATKR